LRVNVFGISLLDARPRLLIQYRYPGPRRWCWRAKEEPAHPATAKTKRASAEIVSHELLNEPPAGRARVLELLDRWFDRWLGV